MISVENIDKSFTLHTQGGVSYSVLEGVSFRVKPGECLVLNGPSGAGKSTLLRALYANYKVDRGHILIRHNDQQIDITEAEPRAILAIRRSTVGYVSQFLRTIPRVSALDVVAEPLLGLGVEQDVAYEQACTLLERLHIPERLFHLAPATFSGGEQQRINIARGFLPGYPVMLLDEPTASLDARNRQVVVELIEEAKARGAAIVGIFHDEEVREAVATDYLEMTALESAA
ncbi:MAG: phosphonate C-P lyase system protein PhnL [Chromatiales bacterium]|nr:phosphonate C-P lyase system protein PhnL [Chromatiales bacterium]